MESDSPKNQLNLLAKHSTAVSHLPGKWLISYLLADHAHRDIWLFLFSLQDWLEREGHTGYDLKTIRIKRGGENRFFCAKGQIVLEAGDTACLRFREERFEPDPIAMPALMAPIHRVRLGFFRARGDPRWDSLRLPSSLLFLASPLHAAGFQVQVAQIHVGPDAGPMDEKPDLLGFTLYEDNFPEVQQYLRELRKEYNGMVAAGGPMVTLSPWVAAYHLPQVNLLVRGEAEAVFPRILAALNRGDWTSLWRERGLFFQDNCLMIISDFDHIHQPGADELSCQPFNLAFAEKSHLLSGLEINFSRGCRRGCFFCSRVHGRGHRKLSGSAVQVILRSYNERRRELGIETQESATVNINDDDILQDRAFSADVVRLIRGEGLRIWGVQTALCSLVSAQGRIESSLLDLLADPDLYTGGRPLLWIGTDAFLPERAKRLGKAFPPLSILEGLFLQLEEKQMRHYHYWISSDAESSWEEFIRELDLIAGFFERYRFFNLLPHAPFLIPYASTSMYHRLAATGKKDQIRFKKELSAPHPRLTYPLVIRVEPRYENLNRLLRDEGSGSGRSSEGFFTALKRNDFFRALTVAYQFLRCERLQAESAGNGRLAGRLKESEAVLENRMGIWLEKRGR